MQYAKVVYSTENKLFTCDTKYSFPHGGNAVGSFLAV
jgi:hypothetical protein